MTSPNRPLKLEDIKKPELAEGAHPFAEEVAVGEEADNQAPVDYRGAYEQQGHSSGLLLLIMSPIGFLASVLLAASYLWPETGGLLATFGWLVSWIIAVPALVFAVNDLKAIRLGQLSDQGQWQTQMAFWLALLTIINSAATVITLFVFGGE